LPSLRDAVLGGERVVTADILADFELPDGRVHGF
jgi:hypothetical protein